MALKHIKFIKSNNVNCDLLDEHRLVETVGGYTWNWQHCYSRLDYVFMLGYLTSRINSVETDWAYKQPDHASVAVKMSIRMDIAKGPSLTTVNEKNLEDLVKLECAKNEIREMMAQVLDGWDPLMKMEYLKVVIRLVIAGLVGRLRKDMKEEILDLESQLNDMKFLNEKSCLKNCITPK